MKGGKIIIPHRILNSDGLILYAKKYKNLLLKEGEKRIFGKNKKNKTFDLLLKQVKYLENYFVESGIFDVYHKSKYLFSIEVILDTGSMTEGVYTGPKRAISEDIVMTQIENEFKIRNNRHFNTNNFNLRLLDPPKVYIYYKRLNTHYKACKPFYFITGRPVKNIIKTEETIYAYISCRRTFDNNNTSAVEGKQIAEMYLHINHVNTHDNVPYIVHSTNFCFTVSVIKQRNYIKIIPSFRILKNSRGRSWLLCQFPFDYALTISDLFGVLIAHNIPIFLPRSRTGNVSLYEMAMDKIRDMPSLYKKVKIEEHHVPKYVREDL